MRAVSCFQRGFAVVSIAALAACGGGDGGGGDGGSTVAVAHKVGGSLSGLQSGKSLVLQNNGADDLQLSANGAFSFSTTVQPGGKYAVTVKTQPDGQTCKVTNGSGNAQADVSNVAVSCSTVVTPPVASGNWIHEGADYCSDIPRTFDGYLSTTAGLNLVDNGATLTNTQGVFFFTSNGCGGAYEFKSSTTVWAQVLRSRYEYQGIPIRRVTSTTTNAGRTDVNDEVWWNPAEGRLCVMADSKASTNAEIGDLVKNYVSTNGCYRKFP